MSGNDRTDSNLLAKANPDTNNKGKSIKEFINLFKSSKPDTTTQTDQITSFELINKVQAEKNISLEQMLSAVENQVQKRTKEVEAALATSREAFQSQNLYVQELEASNKKLMAEMNVKKVPETSRTHLEEIAGKDNLIRSLQDDKKNLKAEVESIQAKLGQLEDELDKLERVNRESTSRIQHFEVELTRANDQKETWRKMHEIAKERAQESNRIKYDKSNHDKTKQELAHIKEQLVKSAADYTMSQGKLEKLQSAFRDLKSESNKIQKNRDELQQRVDDLIRSKAHNTAAMSFSEQKTTDTNPALVTKIHGLKASNLMYKDENKYLKERVCKLTMALSKNQNLDDLLKSGSSDDETGNMVDYMHDKSPRESKSKRHSSISSHQPTDSGMIPSRSVKSTSLLNTASSHQTPKLSEPSVNPARGLNVALGKPAVATQQGLARSASRLSPPVPAQVLPARPPILAVVPKDKKKDNRLTKFINSRNPSKVIDSRPIILPVHNRPPTTEERRAKKTKMDT
ncbi:uncharacterized protein EV154DRAFT_559096 [Mucor mucedo]|uniref:uncharacterized protein n=1 Tax=Mucor mucedo TaxID=29922 RepID=UPI00222097E5|nr:uncharacterized protein EV154DRAFT_559096 [Mucor mucedo]KAI7895678.1 hypothetical protein EV154DRAFT_559096 [Mucor mucedo]